MACRKQIHLLRQVFILLFLVNCVVLASKDNQDKKEDNVAGEKWKKKKIQDYSDADVERLFDQWEDNDEDELEEDELPEWKREPPKVDLSQLDPSNPEGMLKVSKKGKTLMMFATISGEPTQRETEQISQLWHTSLFNANYDTQRFVVSEDRVIFMLSDGSKAWEVKDFLVKQERCKEVSIEGKSYDGAAVQNSDDNRTTKKSDTDDKKPSITKDNKIKKIKKEKKEEL
ncbi:LDLR chaperone boca-like [Mizuhopecten yessoensis]|uniref:LDLR chaperone MESD n=1 Tax=Mizuhopecten yessoensis TaxID=6573 RepID=A0A210PMX2_MIZYE|nr:LDLR chaperone boca-like [Mizuhopecten yessoensis]OWF37849.1 LDLR chaperone MESD [Mizuhopecten yessoensis]